MTPRVPHAIDTGPDRLLREIRESEPAIVDLTARLVGTPSYRPDHDERGMVAVLRHAADELGLPRGSVHAADPSRPNLVIRLGGRRPGRRLLLNGHTDTKPPGPLTDWPDEPCRARVANGLLHGLGAADMKGAIAAMLHAAAAVRRAGLPRRGELILAFTADEEASGTLGLASLVAAGLEAEVAVIGEPSGLAASFDTLPIGSRGFVGFTLRAHGPRVHSALADRLDQPTAIATLAHVVDRLPALVDFRVPARFPFEDGPGFSPATSFEAGVAPGVHPGVATAVGEVRTVPGMTRDSVAEGLRAALAQLGATPGGDLRVDLEVDPEDWPPSVVDADDPVVAALARAATLVLGRSPALGIFPGASEAHVLASRGIGCVPAFGPGLLSAAHVPGERVAVADLVAAASIYALAAADLLG